MNTLSAKLFTLLVFAGSTAFAQEPADTLKDVRPFGTHALELLMPQPGVEVISTTGEPGMTPTIHIRGVGVLSGIQPLYIVDGMRMQNLDGIAPEFIETIKVLKDASAMGIYGPEASAGVVVVTTRRASQKGFHAGYAFDGGFQSLAHEPAKMSLEEWRSYHFYLDEHYKELDQPIPETSFMQKHTLRAQYSGSNWRAFAGFSLLDNDGPYSGRNDTHRRYAASWSAEYHPLKWLSLETTGRWANSSASQAPASWLNNYINSVRYESDDGYSDKKLFCGWDRFTETAVQGEITIHPLSGLFFRGFGAFSQGERELYSSTWHDYANPDYDGDYVFLQYNHKNRKWAQAGISADWNGQWKGHSIHLGAGFRWLKEDRQEKDITNGNVKLLYYNLSIGDNDALINDVLNPFFERKAPVAIEDFLGIDGGPHIGYTKAILNRQDGAEWKENTFSFSYDWRNRYRLDVSYFYIWSKKYFDGAFNVPAITLSWNPSEEPFLRRLLPAWWTDWSVKASWSKSKEYLSILDIEKWLNDFGRLNAVMASRHRDINTTLKFRAGNFALNFSAAWYVNDDDCISYPMGNIISKGVPYSLRNTGVELSANIHGASGPFRYSFSAWTSLYRNRVELPQTSGVRAILWSDTGWITNEAPVGVNDVYNVGEDYIYSENSEPRGSVFPSFTGGFRISGAWKQWQLTLSGHGDGGQTIYHYNEYDAACRYYAQLQQSFSQLDGKDFYYESFTKNQYAILPGDFFRIDQIRLDYTLPIRRVKLNLFASLENWFLFTKYPGSDPELALAWNGIGAETAYHPSTRRTIFGVSVNF